MESFVNGINCLYTSLCPCLLKKSQEQKPLIQQPQADSIELNEFSIKKVQSMIVFENKEKLEISQVKSMRQLGNSKQDRSQSPKQLRLSDSDSFVTIISTPQSSSGILRRTFKSKSRKRKQSQAASIKINEFDTFKSVVNVQADSPDLVMNSADSKMDKYVQYFIEWNKKEYLPSENRPDQHMISHAEKLKLSNQILLDQAVNLLEDYFVFYLNEKNINNCTSKKELGVYQNKSFGLTCSYRLQDQNMSTNTYMKMVSFSCNIQNPIKFLKWYNSVETQAVFNNFYNIQLLENGEFPVFEVEQYGVDIRGKNVYTIIRQIEEGSFDHQPEKQYILQMDTTMGKSKRFRSLLRFDIHERSNVEIYWECSEEIKTNYSDYFRKQWKKLQEKFQKDKIFEFSFSKKYNR